MKKVVLSLVLAVSLLSPSVFAFSGLMMEREYPDRKIICLLVGLFFETFEDYQTALLYRKVACDESIPLGCRKLNSDLAQALKATELLFIENCNIGDSQSCGELGGVYVLTGQYQQAKEYAEKACYSGQLPSSLGCGVLGIIFQEGLGVERNTHKAQDYYKRACDLGNNFSCIQLKLL